METISGAVLIVGYFVISIFQYPLGQPVYKFYAYPNMQVCEQYAQQHISQNKISSEFTLVINAQCMTQEDYNRAVQERNRQLQNGGAAPSGK